MTDSLEKQASEIVLKIRAEQRVLTANPSDVQTNRARNKIRDYEQQYYNLTGKYVTLADLGGERK